jgi:hypothetical protein
MKIIVPMPIRILHAYRPMTRLLFILVFFSGLSACDTDAGRSTGTDAELAGSVDSGAEGMAAQAEADSQMTRGMLPGDAARRMGFSLERSLPLIYGLVHEDTELTALLEAYARKVLLAEGLETSEDLETVFAERDEKIMPHLQTLLEQTDGAFIDENWQALETEVNSIGISMTSSEGMFTGLTQTAMLKDQLESIASEPFRLYQDFLNADGNTHSGEYPFNNMAPYGELIRIGEQLKKQYPKNPYTLRIESRFFEALEYMTDIHLVHPGSGMKQQGPAMVFVGGTHTEAYPWITETGSREAFAKENAESRYSDVIQRILENPSEIGTESENLYVIVTAWAKTVENARQKVYANLSEGKDIPHYLEIRRGDGTDQYAIAYRFYEDEEKANTAIEEIQKRIPDAQLIFCSLKNGKLYQLGI